MESFWVCSVLLVLLSVAFLAVPIWVSRKQRGVLLPSVLLVLLPVVVVMLYKHWGNYAAVNVDKMLKQRDAHSPEQLVKALETALEKQPDNYRAWYLLGESWMVSRRFEQAADAFKKAAAITGDAPEPLAKYAQALFLANNRQVTPAIETLVNKVLLQVPNDRTALGLKGIAAFEQKRYRDAITVWEKLLAVTTKPEARKMIASGIKKARQLEAVPKGS